MNRRNNMKKYFFTTLISVVLFLLSFMTADTGVVTMLKSFCLLTVMLWSTYCFYEERRRKKRYAKIKLYYNHKGTKAKIAKKATKSSAALKSKQRRTAKNRTTAKSRQRRTA